MGAFQKTLGPVTLGEINVGMAAAIGAILPLIAQIDLQIAFLGGLKADISAQFNAAVNFQINFTNPLLALANAIKASIQVIAGLQAALALGIPPLSVQISFSVSIAAAALVKLGLFNLAIDVALGVVGVAANLVGEFEASVGAGPVVGYGWSGITLGTFIGELAAHNFVADGFSPFGNVYGILILTESAAAFTGMAALFVTA